MPISHGNGQMAAQSVSLMVTDRTRCNGGCLCCISRMTPGAPECPQVKTCNMNRLEVGLNYARTLGATHAILTGKADPTQESPFYLTELIRKSRQFVPLVDMHTNAYLLHGSAKSEQILTDLASSGLTMITFSIASFDPIVNRKIMQLKRSGAEVIPHARELELLIRCSLVVNKQAVADFEGVMEYIRAAGELGAHMVVVREIWVPEIYASYDADVYAWNLENRVLIQPIQEQFIDAASNPKNKYFIQQRDPLPWGTPVFAVGGFSDKNHGVNVTFAICNEATTGTVMKSIVHKPDGHGYRNWDHNGDILY
jgi:hypothetical protein